MTIARRSGDLGFVVPVVVGLSAVATAYMGWRAARDYRHAKEIEARTRIREARTAEEIARMQKEIADARMAEAQAARDFVRKLRESGASEEEAAMAIAAMTGSDPAEVLRELKEARAAAQAGMGVPGWAIALIAVMGMMMMRR